MRAIDTNVLVYAHREDSEHHRAALDRVEDVASAGRAWAIPFQCLVEFVGIVTHPRIYAPPTPLDVALEAVRALLQLPDVRVLTESPEAWPKVEALIRKAKARGPRVHDARIAAVCKDHGVTEIVTADRRFPRLAGLRVRDLLA